MGLGRLEGFRIVLSILLLAALGAAFAFLVLRFRVRGRLSFGSGRTTVEADLLVSFAGWSRRAAYHLRRSAVIDELGAYLARRDSPGSGLDVLSRAALLRVVWGFLVESAARGGLRSVELLVWLGTGDAAATAIASGLVNGMLGAAAGVWSAGATFPRRLRAVCTPVWRDAPVWRVELDCILTPSLSQAIRAAWRAYRLVRARRSLRSSDAAPDAAAREKGQRYARASHPGIDENRYVNHQGNG